MYLSEQSWLLGALTSHPGRSLDSVPHIAFVPTREGVYLRQDLMCRGALPMWSLPVSLSGLFQPRFCRFQSSTILIPFIRNRVSEDDIG